MDIDCSGFDMLKNKTNKVQSRKLVKNKCNGEIRRGQANVWCMVITDENVRAYGIGEGMFSDKKGQREMMSY